MRYELSIEVFDAEFSAASWQRAYDDRLIGIAFEYGATDWHWVERPWGLVLEIAFGSEDWADRWRDVPAVRSAFDAVPDPVNGLVFHRGWGGTAGSGEPRRPRPVAGAGAAELPIPPADEAIDAVASDVATSFPAVPRSAAACA